MVDVLERFWQAMAVWTGAIAVLLLGITSLTGGAGLLANAPVWIGMAFMLAAYPAGITTSGSVLDGAVPRLARVGVFAAVSATSSVATFVLVNWVGPAVLPPTPGPFPDPAAMTLPELSAEIAVLAERARAGPATADNWMPFNHLAFHFVRRTDGLLLPALFAWVGLLTGYWTGRIDHTQRRRLLAWAVGSFLMVSTYMAGENGYEMILTRIGGPAEFVADLVLIVPGTLVVGLGLATLAHLWAGPPLAGEE